MNTFGQTDVANRAAQARASIQLAIAGISALVAVIAIIFAVVKK